MKVVLLIILIEVTLGSLIRTKSWSENITIENNQNTMVEYWTEKVFNNETGETKLEFHGNCFMWGVDARNWKANDRVQCLMGFYYEENRIDWIVTSLDY